MPRSRTFMFMAISAVLVAFIVIVWLSLSWLGDSIPGASSNTTSGQVSTAPFTLARPGARFSFVRWELFSYVTGGNDWAVVGLCDMTASPDVVDIISTGTAMDGAIRPISIQPVYIRPWLPAAVQQDMQHGVNIDVYDAPAFAYGVLSSSMIVHHRPSDMVVMILMTN